LNRGAPSPLRVDAEQDLEVAALGVMTPEDVRDVVGVVVSVRPDAAADHGMPDMDAPPAELVVQHPGVDDLAGEGDPHARTGPGWG
jgi:hypothetical protein